MPFSVWVSEHHLVRLDRPQSRTSHQVDLRSKALLESVEHLDEVLTGVNHGLRRSDLAIGLHLSAIVEM